MGTGVTLASSLGKLSRALASGLPVDHSSSLVRFDDRTEVLAGFETHALSPRGEMMDDGVAVPELHDGMGCFLDEDGGYTLVIFCQPESTIYSNNSQKALSSQSFSG